MKAGTGCERPFPRFGEPTGLAVSRTYLHRRGIAIRIARHRVEDKTKLGRHRWVVERTISWLLRFKRLGPVPPHPLEAQQVRPRLSYGSRQPAAGTTCTVHSTATFARTASR